MIHRERVVWNSSPTECGGHLCYVVTSSFVYVNLGKVPVLQGCDGELGSWHNALVSSSYYLGPQ